MSGLHQSKSYPQTSILNPFQLQHVRSSHSVKGYAAILQNGMNQSPAQKQHHIRVCSPRPDSSHGMIMTRLKLSISVSISHEAICYDVMTLVLTLN
jgi:hypothetical protein